MVSCIFLKLIFKSEWILYFKTIYNICLFDLHNNDNNKINAQLLILHQNKYF